MELAQTFLFQAYKLRNNPGYIQQIKCSHPPPHEHRFMIDLAYLSPMNIEFKFDCNIAYNRNCTELPSMPRLQCPITMFTLLSF